DPRLGRDRRLPAARQHQPARRLLRRLLHRARRAAAPARHGARELPLRLRRAAARRLLEGFAAFGNRVATVPGIPQGSPWEPGGLGFPLPNLRTVPNVPDRSEVRGGARLVFSSEDVTYTLAHYYTYLDVPGIRFRLPGPVPLPGEAAPANFARFGNEIQAIERFPRVPISGASLTFPVPSWYSVVRSEAA